MLSDFLTLEIYFGSENAAQYFEDLVKRYGPKRVKTAVQEGDLGFRKSCSDGKIVAWLTQSGRSKALLSS